ncbi:SRPBCC family protein [Cytophagaceae bacterium YF14B1]|uniref:SRPBCC family protein n=1 Tax=Xanthocytophaga flava TaxID=3048013 RepID=A0AAE3QQ69_9BACT|nr:SRPBCC family protein [Xanthocytophaga flavus]MDJ1481195.1 SRPBCC family protein [Xanthocytophaga flavus]
MWIRSHSVTTQEVTKEQLWQLFADVDNWAAWDEGVEYAKLEGKFEKGAFFTLKPKGGPKVKIQLIETTKNKSFTDMTRFPMGRMYGEHTFEETTEGLRITTTMKVEGLLGFFWRKVVAQSIVDALPTEMLHQIQVAKKL